MGVRKGDKALARRSSTPRSSASRAAIEAVLDEYGSPPRCGGSAMSPRRPCSCSRLLLLAPATGRTASRVPTRPRRQQPDAVALSPGSSRRRRGPSRPPRRGRSTYEQNAWHVSEGKRLFALVQLHRLPRAWRRRHGPAADGRPVDLRRRARSRSPPRIVRAGRTACPRFGGQHPGRPDLAARRLRALA